jgi:hypothetical protein
MGNRLMFEAKITDYVHPLDAGKRGSADPPARLHPMAAYSTSDA